MIDLLHIIQLLLVKLGEAASWSAAAMVIIAMSRTYTWWLTVQVGLAKKLVDLSFADKVFFCNSGAEANEAAIKFARKWSRQNGECTFHDVAMPSAHMI